MIYLKCLNMIFYLSCPANTALRPDILNMLHAMASWPKS